MTRDEAAAMLGVPTDAPEAEVQHAFLRMARRVHPDTLPDAGDAERRAAAARFDALVQARSVLLAPATARADVAGDRRSPDDPRFPAGYRPRPSDPDGPRYREVRGRGLGGSLVVLALLAFLLVALVTLDDAFRSHAFQPVGGGVTSTSTVRP